jgi:hypothetical protein
MKKIFLLMMIMVLGMSTNVSFAATVVNNSATTENFSNPVEKKGVFAKMKAKATEIAVKQMLKKAPKELNIPGSAKTWLIYWLLGVVASIVLVFVLPVNLYFIYRLLGAATSVAFIIWILKLLDVV